MRLQSYSECDGTGKEAEAGVVLIARASVSSTYFCGQVSEQKIQTPSAYNNQGVLLNGDVTEYLDP